jgi:hypothetical protein
VNDETAHRYNGVRLDHGRGTVFEHDVIIRPDGQVKKRKKKLSKALYGTSHTISLQEAKYVHAQAAGIDQLIVGSGRG